MFDIFKLKRIKFDRHKSEDLEICLIHVNKKRNSGSSLVDSNTFVANAPDRRTINLGLAKNC